MSRGRGPSDRGSARGKQPGGSRRRRPGPAPTRRGEPAVRKAPTGRRGLSKRSGRSGSAPGDRSRPSGERRGVGGEQVEGRHAVLELLMTGARQVQVVWISKDSGRAAVLDDIRTVADGQSVPVKEMSRERFSAQARCEAPQGVLAMASALPDHSLEDMLEGRRLLGGQPAASRGSTASTHPFLMALDGLTDPGNLGAVLRSAECAGVTGVILPRHRAVNVTPTVTKAAAGAVEHLPMAMVGGIPSALKQMRDRGLLVVGLDSDGDTSVYELPPVDGPVCLVLGAEGKGLSRLTSQRCDVIAHIPLHGSLPSLNVSAAAAVACFEVSRARS